MRSQKSFLGLVTFVLLMVGPSVMAADTERVLFTFDKPDSGKQWQTVNDGVMGGVSDGRFKINDDKNMEFFGTLSLENNGGFASVRSQPTEVNIRKGDSIVARLRGDGREYTINLYVPRGSGGNSFRQSFKTKKGEWIEVSIPVNKFVATFRGRVFPNQKLDPNKVNSVGFLLGDKVLKSCTQPITNQFTAGDFVFPGRPPDSLAMRVDFRINSGKLFGVSSS